MAKNPMNCALLTSLGRGAVAVIAVFGESLAERIEPLFESATGKRLVDSSPETFLYGRWRSTGEDVILAPQAGRIEIHCHGGQAAPAAILRNLHFAGFHQLNEEEAAARLFGDDWTAEVALCLSKAPTERTAEILLSQLQLAPQALPQLEANCRSDDPETRQETRSAIQRILGLANFGLHLAKPWTVVLCGSPNVGKSSMINAIVGFERAIVHSEAGTTRDVVTQLTAVEGWPIDLRDTAGLREAKSEIERQGVQFSWAEIESADLLLAVFDSTEIDPEQFDWEFLRKHRVDIVILNKSDLLTKDELKRLGADHWNRIKPADLMTVEFISVSATRQLGINNLVSAIATKLVPEIPSTDTLIPVSARQIESLQRMAELRL
jgi:tRNA modification GTPase